MDESRCSKVTVDDIANDENINAALEHLESKHDSCGKRLYKGKLNIAAVETERVFNYKLVDFVLFLVYDKEKTSEILRRNEKSPT